MISLINISHPHNFRHTLGCHTEITLNFISEINKIDFKLLFWLIFFLGDLSSGSGLIKLMTTLSDFISLHFFLMIAKSKNYSMNAR